VTPFGSLRNVDTVSGMANRSRRLIEDVFEVVGTHMPGYQVETVVPAGEGLEHVVFEVNGELIVRFSRRPDPTQLDNEVRLLRAVADKSPLRVSEPMFVAMEQGCLAYFRLPGIPLLEVPAHQRGATSRRSPLRSVTCSARCTPPRLMNGLSWWAPTTSH
jgi:hypothetical protein